MSITWGFSSGAMAPVELSTTAASEVLSLGSLLASSVTAVSLTSSTGTATASAGLSSVDTWDESVNWTESVFSLVAETAAMVTASVSSFLGSLSSDDDEAADCSLCCCGWAATVSSAAGVSLLVATSAAAAAAATLAVTSSCDGSVGCGSAAGVANDDDGSTVTSDAADVAGFSFLDDDGISVEAVTVAIAGAALKEFCAAEGTLFTDGGAVPKKDWPN